MCVAKRGQQAKRVDDKTFKWRLRDEQEMFESKEGARALLADPLPVRLFFRIILGTSFFMILIDSDSSLASVFHPFSIIFASFFEHRIMIDLSLIL